MPTGPRNDLSNDVINAGILCSQQQELDGYLKTVTSSVQPRLF